VERVVVTSKISFEFQESLNNEFLNFTALGERVAWGELEATDGTASSAAGSQDVLTSRVNLGGAEVIWVHVSGMSVPGLVTVVALVNDMVKERGEGSVRFFIASNDTAGLNMGVTLVVNAGLDALTEVDSQLGRAAGEALVEAGVGLKSVSHEVVVVLQVGAFLWHNLGSEGGILLMADVLGTSASETDEVRESEHIGAETFWRVVSVSERNLALVIEEVSTDKGGTCGHEHS